jgi:hypothetical protein
MNLEPITIEGAVRLAGIVASATLLPAIAFICLYFSCREKK